MLGVEMNIFYLSKDASDCAQMHCDKHTVKMIIEYAQLLSTTHRVLDGDEYYDKTKNGRRIKRWRMDDHRLERNLYKASHINHCSNIWTRNSSNHYQWLLELWKYLCKEYTHRYERHHLTEIKLSDTLINHPKNITNNGFTDPPPAMPEYCKIQNNVVASYRKYYIFEKNSFVKWTKRPIPEWYHAHI